MRMFNIESLSFWERDQYLERVDAAVVGGGIVGMTTAIFLKKLRPNLRVLVLERGVLPAGASSKNAGFACFGSLSELAADLNHEPFDAVLDLVEKRYNGLTALRKLLGEAAIGYQPVGGFELFMPQQPELLEAAMQLMPTLNAAMADRLGLDHTYARCDDLLPGWGFSGFNSAICNRFEGSIDTGLLFTNLQKLALDLGVKVLCGVEVASVSNSGQGALVEFAGGSVLKCGHVHVATNGFAASLINQADVKPARAQVLVTEPLAQVPFEGTFHLDEGYYYFRNVGNRVLLGGGRNLDIEGETTTQQVVTQKIQSKLDELLKAQILPNVTYSVFCRWAGTMGVGSSKSVILKQVQPHVTCAVRLGGMGVALGTEVGMASAKLILGVG